MKDNGKYLQKPDSFDLQKVFEFTNYSLNVWDYIVPALKEGIIDEIVQIRSDEELKNSKFVVDLCNSKTDLVWNKKKDIILNLDLDFFEPNLNYINYDLKKKVILNIAKNASVITVASSPFFINQKLALKRFLDIF
jgi:hypothetical protein